MLALHSASKGPTSGPSFMLLALLLASLPEAARVLVMSQHASASSGHCSLACLSAATTACSPSSSSALLHDVGLGFSSLACA
jgi:hypothetical protein